MSSKTDPDQQLRQFLQRYQPPISPPSPDLEAQLFQRLDRQPPLVIVGRSPWCAVLGPKPRRWWAGTLALAALAIGGGATWRWQTQTALNPTSPEILEAFLADSWTGAIAVSEEATWVEVPPEQSSPSQEWWQLTQSTGARDGHR